MALQEADYGLTDAAFQGAQGRFRGDDTLLVKFFTHAKMNQTESEEKGRPVFQDVPYIQIMQPGNKDSIIIRPATEMDKQRFAEHFRKFEARESQEGISGTPLEEWPLITRSMVEELRYLNIRTVEQLADLSDSNAQNVMGIQMLKQKALKYMETSKENATAEALDSAHEEIETLKAQMATLLNAVPEVEQELDEEEYEE